MSKPIPPCRECEYNENRDYRICAKCEKWKNYEEEKNAFYEQNRREHSVELANYERKSKVLHALSRKARR